MKKKLLTLFFGLWCLLYWNIDYAQVSGHPQLKSPSLTTVSPDKSPTRLSPELRKLTDQNNGPALRSLSVQANPVPANSALDKYLQMQGNGIVIDITVRGNINSAKADLQKMGLKVTGVYGRMISGIMPVANLPQLESISSIQYARPA